MMEKFGNYTGLWDHDIEPDTMYIKIGDPGFFALLMQTTTLCLFRTTQSRISLLTN
jgi:hypothetical protein